jgi:hypothetical protein
MSTEDERYEHRNLSCHFWKVMCGDLRTENASALYSYHLPLFTVTVLILLLDHNEISTQYQIPDNQYCIRSTPPSCDIQYSECFFVTLGLAAPHPLQLRDENSALWCIHSKIRRQIFICRVRYAIRLLGTVLSYLCDTHSRFT